MDFALTLGTLDQKLSSLLVKIESGLRPTQDEIASLLGSLSKLEKAKTNDEQQEFIDVRIKKVAELLQKSVGETSTQRSPEVNLPYRAQRSELDIQQMIVAPDERLLFSDLVGLKKVKLALIQACIIPLTMKDFVPAEMTWKGVLLFGGSGVGKSKVIVALVNSMAKKINSSVTFLRVSNDHILGNFYGDTEKNITNLFKGASKLDPCVLLFDELDSLAGNRSDSNRDYENKIINHLLITLDGLSTSRPIIAVCTTNRPQHIDEVFLRRINLRIYVELPTLEDRMEFLERKLTRIQPKESSKIDYVELGERTEGYSQADLDSLVIQAYQDVHCKKVAENILMDIENQKVIAVNLKDAVPTDSSVYIKQDDLLRALQQVAPTNSKEVIWDLDRFAEKFCNHNRHEPPPPDCVCCTNCDDPCLWIWKGCETLCQLFNITGTGGEGVTRTPIPQIPVPSNQEFWSTFRTKRPNYRY